MCTDLGITNHVEVLTDASAAKGIATRIGLGKVRHLETSQLWLQAKVADGSISITKVKGIENPADLFTNHLTSEPCVRALMRLFGCEYREGRPDGAPELR